MIARRMLHRLAPLLVFAMATTAAAQEARPPERRPPSIEFNFQDTELRLVLVTLAEAAGLNVVFSNIPSRQVTLRTSRPVSTEEARSYLESVVRSNGLTMEEENGLIRISGEAPRAAEPPPMVMQVSRTAQARLYVYQLRHAQADELAATIADLFGISRSSVGSPQDPSRSLSEQLRDQRLPPGFPPDPAGAAPEGQGAAGGAGAPGQSLTAGLQGAVQIVPDPRTNSLLIRASAADYETLRAAIQQLDARPLQVLIEVLIAEVRRDKQIGAGIGVSVPDQRVGQSGTTVGGEMTGASAGDLILRILDIGRIKADVVLRMLAASSDVTILSRPIVLAQNNQEARILVGSERPFVQLYRALPTENAVRDQVIQYRDVGTQLTIRPTINPDGYVSLNVLQEVSNATAETQFGAPIISTREARTQLLIRNGQTAVIGGLIDQTIEKSSSGIPFLKDIPVIGRLFRSSQQDRKNVTEMFLFLTPHVLRTDEDLEDATQKLQESTEELRRRVPDPVPLLAPGDTMIDAGAARPTAPTAAPATRAPVTPAPATARPRP